MPAHKDCALSDETISQLADAVWARILGSGCNAVEFNLRAKLALEYRLVGSGAPPFGLDKLGTEEAAAYLDLQPGTLHDRQKRKVLRLPEPYRFGRKLHWRRSELDAWIEAQREWERVRKENWFPGLARCHAHRIMQTARLLYQRVPDIADKEMHNYVEQCLQKSPPPLCTKHQAAMHEAGHFVAFEVEGMGASVAGIHGSRFGRSGWGGTASALANPVREVVHFRQSCKVSDLLSDARSALCGPLSEALLAEGDFSSSISEIIESYVLAARAAGMIGLDYHQVLTDILVGTVAIVDAYADEIKHIAALLERRRRISRCNCEAVLARVRRPLGEILPAARREHVEKLMQLVTTAVPGIEGLISQLATPGIAT